MNNVTKWRWSEFVREDKAAPVVLSLEWKNIIEEVFRLKPYYYIISNEKNELVSIAPFFLVKSFIFGNRLISLPFTDYGGIYFKKEITLKDKNAVLKSLFKEIDILVKEFRLDYVELRGKTDDSLFKTNNNYFVKVPYVNFRIDLTTPFEDISNKFSRSIRRAVIKNNSKGSRNKVKVVKCEEKKLLNKVYDMYLWDLRKFGSPPLPKLYIEKEWDILKEKNMFEIFLAYYNDRIIGAKSFLIYEKKVYGELSISDPRFDVMTPKIHLYYETLKWANSQEYYFYDFGRTRKYSGVYEHKKKWGGKETDISYSFVVYNKRADTILDADQEKFLLPQRILKKLPLFLLKRIGPKIRKNLGK